MGSFNKTLALCLVLLPFAALAQPTVSVTPADNLALVVQKAAAGSTILLAGGDYGAVTLRGVNGTATMPITLRSADPADPAKLTGLNLREVNHLTLDGLSFDYSYQSTDTPSERPFQIFASRDIAIQNNLFDGDEAASVAGQPAYPTGFGLAVRSSAGIRIQQNEFRNFYRGMVINDVVDLQVRANDLHSIRMDGMTFAQVERVLIEGNTIHDFKRAVESADHADMIQFWTNQTERPTRDVTIRNNVLNSGLGWFTQSIFMRNDQVDQGLAGQEMFYRNITIEGNVIINAHLHGITVGETDGLVIRNNTILHNARSDGKKPNRALWIPQVRVSKASVNVQILDNILHKITGYAAQATWTVQGNHIVQDRAAKQPSDYDLLFVAAQTGDPRDLGSFQYLASGGLAQAGVGAPMLRPQSLRPDPPSPQTSPMIQSQPDPNVPNRFGLSISAKDAARLALDPAQINWDFGDGTTARGLQASHDYAKAGVFEVKLHITLASGQSLESLVHVTARQPKVIHFEPENGTVTSFANDLPEVLDLPISSGPIQLGGTHPVITLPRDVIAPLFGNRYFLLQTRVRAEGGYRAAGTVLQIYKTLAVSINDRGAFEVEFASQTVKKLTLITPPTPVLKKEWVDLQIEYSDSDQSLRLSINGKEVAKGKTSGPLRPAEHWGLVLGRAFRPDLTFTGEMARLDLRIGKNDLAVAN